MIIPTTKLSCLVLMGALNGLLSAAPIALTGTMVHSENFDSLGTSTIVWNNDSTLAGWYAQINNGITANGNVLPTNGSAALNGLLNCGSSGSTDRAFGSKPTNSGNIANIACAVSFRNAAAMPVQFTKLNYTGELWRTNTGTGTPLVAVDEIYWVFYQISNAAVTNILSGTSSATATAGTGFVAPGASANWINPVNTPLATGTTGALDGNASANRTAVSYTPATSIVIQPGQFFMIKWTDPNVGGTDGFQAIDDVSIEFTELTGSVTATASTRTRDFSGTPLDTTDDTFGFTANILGSGSVSATWTTADVNPPASNSASGPYGTVIWTGFPIADSKTVVISDSTNPAFSSSVTMDPIRIIGSNNLVTAATPILQEDAPVTGWTIDDAARTLTQNDEAVQNDKFINSQIIDLSSTGYIQFAADLNAISGTSSGFEPPDSFALQLIIDGAAPVSVLGAADTNRDGRLTGFADGQGVGPELPGNDELNVNRPFSFSHIIPDTANSVQIRIVGNSDSLSETFLVKNIRLNQPPPTVFAAIAGPSTFDNKGTANAADDEFSGSVNIVGVNLGTSTNWDSDSTPATGLYSTAVDTFGPYLVSGGAKRVNLFDRDAPTFTTAIIIPLPAATNLTTSAPANITRIENGPGAADDSVSFDLTITGTNGGPGWTATGANPPAGAFGPVTFTVPAPLPASAAIVTIADASYPAVTQIVTVAIPGRYIIGQQDLGGGLSDLKSDPGTTPAPEWVNNAGARTLTMIAGGTGDKVVASEVLNLSSAGIVYFTANFNAAETSLTSNFETNDKFKAELIINGGLVPADIINLVSAWDTGNGDPAVGGAGGPNGAPDSYINGYQGIAIAPATIPDDYNNNRDRDEFNLPVGAPPAQPNAAAQINNNFPLSYTIPATANTVQLKLYGEGASSFETFVVSNVRFSTSGPVPDSDGDGVSSEDELVMGTDPSDATDVLRVSQNAANSNQLDFPTKNRRFYRVYVSNDIDGQEGTHLSIWKDAAPLGLAAGTIAGDGNPASFSIGVAAGEPRRFYRLHVMRMDGTTGLGDWPATVP